MERHPQDGPSWAKRFFAATLFVDDLARERQWYSDVFGMAIVDESPENCVFRFPSGVFVGPIDRPWGSRTATIADPSGNYWELFS